LLDSLLQEISNMTSTEKFCLRWNDFEKNISRAFRELREDKDFFDVTIACDDDQVEAHKVILSACSPFFRTILKKNKHQHPFVYLKGVRYTDLLSVLNFMYHGEVNVAQDDLNTFLSVAEDLKVKGLTQSSSSSNNSYQTSPPRQLTTVNQQTKRNNQEPTLASAPPQAPAYQHNSYHEEDDIQEVTPVIKAEPTLQIYNPASAPIAKQDTNDTHALAATDDYIDYEAYGNSGYEDSIQIPGETETNKELHQPCQSCGILDQLVKKHNQDPLKSKGGRPTKEKALRDKQLKEQLLEKLHFASRVDKMVYRLQNGNINAEELGYSIASDFESRKFK